jgi:membrane associated rhomboid family serine protease
MERLLTSLERRFGKFAPPHIIYWLVGISGLVYFLCYARPDLQDSFVLDGDAVLHGEVWRLVTFLFLPWRASGGMLGPIWTIFGLLFLYTMGRALEDEWGTFRFDAFYLAAALGTVATALLVGPVTNLYINEALMLAFAIEFPDYEIRLYFFLPVKMRWLGLLALGFVLFEFVTGGWPTRAGIAVALVTLLAFCGEKLSSRLRGRALVSSRGRALSDFRSAAAPPARMRVCAKCGKSEKDDPRLEFRICDCQEKCGGRATEYCLEHAKAH